MPIQHHVKFTSYIPRITTTAHYKKIQLHATYTTNHGLTHHKSSMKIEHEHLHQTTTMLFHHMTLVNTKHAAGTQLPSLRAAFNMEAVQLNKKKP
jgi:hypothetical protein